jgi:hypothetical protein
VGWGAVLLRRDGVRQIAIVLGALGVYEAARFAMEPNWVAALANARRIVELERVLSLGWERHLQDAFLAVPDVILAMNVFYFVGHFLLTGVFFVWLYRRSRAGFNVFRDGFLAATLIAVVVHWSFPTAPPRLLGQGGAVDTLLLFSGIDIGSQANETLSNPVAAVPSLHAGYAAGVGAGLLLYARSWPVRAAGVVYPLLVVLTIIVTGNHFVLDALAGVAVMAVGFWAAGRIRSRRSARPARGRCYA